MNLKRIIAFMLVLALSMGTVFSYAQGGSYARLSTISADFDLIVDVLEWGSATTAVIIDMGVNVRADAIAKDTFAVSAVTKNPVNNNIVYDGGRTITKAYVSATSEIGTAALSGRYIVLELKYGYNATNAEVNGCAAIIYQSRNFWLNQEYTVTQSKAIDGIYAPVSYSYHKTVRPIYDDFLLVNNPVEGYTGQTYRVYIPEADGPLPLVVWNHGSGEGYSANGGGNEGAQLFANMGGIGWVKNAPEDSIVLVPQRSLNGYSRAGVIAYINYLVEQGVADASRLYVSGCSAGGQETHSYLREFPDVWAAAVPVCPASGGSLTAAQLEPIKDIPIWYIHSEEDRTVAPSHSLTPYSRLLELGAKEVKRTSFANVFGTEIPNADYENTKYPDGHWSWVIALNNVYVEAEKSAVMDWMFAHKKASLIPDGASFIQINDYGADGSVTYMYTPSVLNDPVPMMTPVIFIYPDQAPANSIKAQQLLSKLGLIDLAERERGVILLATPTGGGWSNDDITVYNALLKGIWFNNNTDTSIKKLTYFNLIYAMGEGSGATFINNKLSQNANRIAGVATFGGDGSVMPASGVPLPAYIAGGSDNAIGYFKAVNNTDQSGTVSGRTVYYNAVNDRQRVMVNPDALTSFDKEAIRQAWDSMLRYTTRAALATRIYDDADSPEVFTLLPRPNVEALGLTMRVNNEKESTRWYEWIPNEALEPGTAEKFPLVLVLHGGGDHDVYEAESNGWVALAGRERFIVASPKTTSKANNLALLKAVIAKYPIDESRIYVTGFSAGSSAINSTLNDKDTIELFAAMAPFSWSRAYEYNKKETKIPAMYHTMDNDINTTGTVEGQGDKRFLTVANNYTTLTNLLGMHNIALPAGAFTSTNTFFRFDTYPNGLDTLTTTYGITGKTTNFYDADGINMVRLSYWEGMDHAHFYPNAEIAWDFLSRFSRDISSKEIIYDDEGNIRATQTMVVEGYDWGPGVSKIILTLDKAIDGSSIDASKFIVNTTKGTSAPAAREVTGAYLCDENGNRIDSASGTMIALELRVGILLTVSNPYQSSLWANPYNNEITSTGLTSNGAAVAIAIDPVPTGKIMPEVDRFDLSGIKTVGDVTIGYAAYSPATDSVKHPLVIWLHGGGEGVRGRNVGLDLPILANNVSNFVRDEFQTAMGGAYVLVPQCPTTWMDAYKQTAESGKEGDTRFTECLLALIKEYVKNNPGIDESRIYVGGCSNGGFMTVKLLLADPDYFAAAYPVCSPYNNLHLTDAQLESIKNVPIRFVQDLADPTVDARYAINITNRLNGMGAADSRISLFHPMEDSMGNTAATSGGAYSEHFAWVLWHSNSAFKALTIPAGTVYQFPVTVNSNNVKITAGEEFTLSVDNDKSDFWAWLSAQKKTDVSATLTSPISKIVAGYAANIPAMLTFTGEPAELAISLSDPNGVLIATALAPQSGTYMFSITAAQAVAGTYTIRAMNGAAAVAETTVECAAQPTDLWHPVVTVSGGNTIVVFASNVTFNEAKKAVSFGGAAIPGGNVTAAGNAVTIERAAEKNQQIVISGIRYADLFPSYSFTFTINYAG